MTFSYFINIFDDFITTPYLLYYLLHIKEPAYTVITIMHFVTNYNDGNLVRGNPLTPTTNTKNLG